MRHPIRWLAAAGAAFGVSVAIFAAPAASAAPQCTNTGPTTTQCESNGNSQIVTSPPLTNNYPYYGFPILGGFGFGIVF